MPSLGDVYVDVHANTRDLKPEVRKAAAEAGDDGGKQFSKSFDKQTKRALGRFEKEFDSSINKALDNLPEIELDADSSDAQREIQKLRGELRALSDLEIGVDIDAAGALARLGAIRVALSALSKDTDLNIGLGARGALASITSLTNLLPEFATGAGGAGGAAARLSASVGGLGASAAASAPLIIAFGAAIALLVGVAGAAAGALGGLALALAAPLGAAAGGTGLFALLSGKFVKQTLEQAKANKSLSATQQAFIAQKDKLKGAFDGLLNRNAEALLAPVTKGMEILTRLMPKLSPLIEAVSKSLTNMLTQLDKSGALDGMIASMTSLVQGGILDKIGSSLGSLGSIFGSIFGAGKDLGVKAIDGMSDALGRLAGYLESAEGQKQLQEFFSWVETHGPGIWQNFLDIAGGVKDFVKAMTPAGEAFLTFLGFFGQFGFLAPVFKAAMAVVMGAFTGLLAIISGVTATLGGLFTLIGSIPGTPDWVDGIGTGLNNISTKAWDATQKMSDLLVETGKAKNERVDIPVDAKTQNAKTAIRAVQALAIVPQTFPLDADKEPADSKIRGWKADWGKPFSMRFDIDISATAQKVMDFVRNFGWIGGKGSWGGAAGGRIPAGFASGGIVPGTTPRNRSVDNVAAVTRKGNPLRVQSGEWIINSAASRQNHRLLEAINNGFNAQRVFGFHAGGLAPARAKTGYASGGRVGESSVVTTSNVNVSFGSAPVSTAKVIQEVDWWSQYGTRTRMRAASA